MEHRGLARAMFASRSAVTAHLTSLVFRMILWRNERLGEKRGR